MLWAQRFVYLNSMLAFTLCMSEFMLTSRHAEPDILIIAMPARPVAVESAYIVDSPNLECVLARASLTKCLALNCRTVHPWLGCSTGCRLAERLGDCAITLAEQLMYLIVLRLKLCDAFRSICLFMNPCQVCALNVTDSGDEVRSQYHVPSLLCVYLSTIIAHMSCIISSVSMDQ